MTYRAGNPRLWFATNSLVSFTIPSVFIEQAFLAIGISPLRNATSPEEKTDLCG
jgi:hypothetical protein